MKEKNVAPSIVYCNKCGMGNPSTNKFCYGCGNSLLSAACAFCSQANPHYAKFWAHVDASLRPKNRANKDLRTTNTPVAPYSLHGSVEKASTANALRR